MNAIYGDIPSDTLPLRNTTSLEYYVDQMPLRWAHSSATSDFLSRFLGGILTRSDFAGDLKDVQYSVGYLINELFENAVKFNAGGVVKISIGLSNKEVVVSVDNLIEPTVSEKFQKLLAEITTGDPGELLIQKIEENAAGGSGSGLGILSLMSDYGVRLGWTFQDAPGEPRVRVITVARLPIS